MAISVVQICRYPVKGLSAEGLERVTLTAGQCLPQDRRFALAQASTQFDPTRPRRLPTINFLMLMRNEKPAHRQTRLDKESGYFTIDTPRVVEAPDHSFSDASQKPNSTTYQYLSAVNARTE